MQKVTHNFVDENGQEVLVTPTRLGSEHEITGTTVYQDFDGSLVFTHSVARQHTSEGVEPDGN